MGGFFQGQPKSPFSSPLPLKKTVRCWMEWNTSCDTNCARISARPMSYGLCQSAEYGANSRTCAGLMEGTKTMLRDGAEPAADSAEQGHPCLPTGYKTQARTALP